MGRPRLLASIACCAMQLTVTAAFMAQLAFRPALSKSTSSATAPTMRKLSTGPLSSRAQSQFDPSRARSRISRAVHEMWTSAKSQQPSRKSVHHKPQQTDVHDPVHPPPGADSQVLVIGVAGGSGGGKSVFCTKLEAMLEDICPTVVLSHDSYYRDGPEVDRECGGNWDCPDALSTSELVADLQRLKAGETAQIPIYSFAANARVQNQSIPQCIPRGTRGVLLVEGLMVLHDEALRQQMDVRVYVDCDEDTRFMRRLARDTHPLKGRGRTVADVYRAWAKNVKPNHHRYVEPTKRFAHMIVPHHGVFADPGHLLAVGEDPTALLDAYVNKVYVEGHPAAPDVDVASHQEPQAAAESNVAAIDSEGEGHMWPALYMLRSYVREFSAGGDAASKGTPATITISH